AQARRHAVLDDWRGGQPAAHVEVERDETPAADGDVAFCRPNAGAYRRAGCLRPDLRARATHREPHGRCAMTTMSDKERAETRRHINDREKLAKALAAERSAVLLAEFEKEVSSTYAWSQSDVWNQAHSMAQRAVAEAQRMIDAKSERLGIPTNFRPGIHTFWT